MAENCQDESYSGGDAIRRFLGLPCQCAYTPDKKLVSTFSANLETLDGAAPHPKTAAWWATQPEAWAACRKDLQKPEGAMREGAGHRRLRAPHAPFQRAQNGSLVLKIFFGIAP